MRFADRLDLKDLYFAYKYFRFTKADLQNSVLIVINEEIEECLLLLYCVKFKLNFWEYQ